MNLGVLGFRGLIRGRGFSSWKAAGSVRLSQWGRRIEEVKEGEGEEEKEEEAEDRHVRAQQQLSRASNCVQTAVSFAISYSCAASQARQSRRSGRTEICSAGGAKEERRRAEGRQTSCE